MSRAVPLLQRARKWILRTWRNPHVPGREQQRWLELSFIRLQRRFERYDFCSQSVLTQASPELTRISSDGIENLTHWTSVLAGRYGFSPARLRIEVIRDPVESSIPTTFSGLDHGKPVRGASLVSLRDQPIMKVDQSALDFDVVAIASMSREFAHWALSRSSAQDNNERLVDLTTVYFGVGPIAANAAFQFGQWTQGLRGGWKVRRLGFLDDRMFGYALALFAYMRGNLEPTWANELRPDVLKAFRDSALEVADRSEELKTRLIICK